MMVHLLVEMLFLFPVLFDKEDAAVAEEEVAIQLLQQVTEVMEVSLAEAVEEEAQHLTQLLQTVEQLAMEEMVLYTSSVVNDY
jgi:Mor family transcriptional regulator